MTTKAKTTEKTAAICCNCAHRYEVKSNTPNGLTAYYYCRKSGKDTPFGFLLTKDDGSCENFKLRDDERKG